MVVTRTQHIFTSRRKKLEDRNSSDKESSVSREACSEGNVLADQEGEEFFANLDWSDLLTTK